MLLAGHAHLEGVGNVVRFGPVAILVLFLAGAWLSQQPSASRAAQLRAGAAVAFGSAGVLHLLLVPDHFGESTYAGFFFIAAGIAELLLAAGLLARPSSVLTTLVAGLALLLLLIYAVTRIVAPPFQSQPEPVDAIGLITKTLELGAALLALLAERPVRLRWPWPAVSARNAAGAAALGLMALVAFPLYLVGPEPLQAAIAMLAAAATAVAIRRSDPEGVVEATRDAAVLALIIRSSEWWSFALLGLLAGALRALARTGRPVPAPAAIAGLVTLGLADARMQIFHVTHAGDAVGACLAFLFAAAVLATLNLGQLMVVATFYGVHLTGQALRMLLGLTSLEAIEVPAASLGVFVIAALMLADPELRLPIRQWLGAAGGAAAIDVLMRQLELPYAPLVAVATATAVLALTGWLSRLRPKVQAGLSP